MNRKEIYKKIQDMNLQEAIKAKFGDNYTRIGSDALESFIAQQEAGQKQPVANNVETTEADSAFEAACLAFLGILEDNGLLEDLLEKL